MSGPPKIPTELKILRGTTRDDRVAPDAPKPPTEIPTKPKHLSAEAAREWKRITVELAVLGLLTRIDRAALAMYCTAWGRHLRCEALIAKSIKEGGIGELSKTRFGDLSVDPLVTLSAESAKLAHRFLIEFGMTPASRTRISAKPKEAKPQSGWGKFAR